MDGERAKAWREAAAILALPPAERQVAIFLTIIEVICLVQRNRGA